MNEFITTCGGKQYGFHLVHHPKKKHMPSPGYEPGSPQPQSKSEELDRSAMGPAFTDTCSLIKHDLKI